MRPHVTNKRRWSLTGLVLLATLLLIFVLPATALAWDDCPYGEVDCVYPGDCARYIDTNNDGICDRSQPEPTTATVDSETAVDESSTVTSEEASTGGGRGRNRGTSTLASTESPTTSTTLAVAALTSQPPTGGDPGGGSFLTHYYVSPIALVFFLVYLASFILYKTKTIRMATHRKIWNVLLLATFLITGIFGLILTIQLDYDLPFQMPVNLLFWHVEAGIVMTLISLFHIGWHFKYYANLLRTSRSKARAAEARERAYTRRPVRQGQVAMTSESVRPAERHQPGWESL